MEALARSETLNHRLWIAGRDDSRPWKRRATRLGIADRVRFLGERRDLDVLYRAVDAMVLPTRYDPFANVTLEAAAAGLPIVTSSANGAVEWLGHAIRVVEDIDDPAALASALTDFNESDQRKKAGESLALKAQEFGWPRHVETLLEEYDRIVQRRRRASQR
jgi:UDP-glucose:(heptosyl)LPS alpha-1,3-glucosyltransferase